MRFFTHKDKLLNLTNSSRNGFSKDSCRVLGIPVIGEKEPIPQSSVVSKHFCFKTVSPAKVGTELKKKKKEGLLFRETTGVGAPCVSLPVLHGAD